MCVVARYAFARRYGHARTSATERRMWHCGDYLLIELLIENVSDTTIAAKV
jgi:hypothetical protein